MGEVPLWWGLGTGLAVASRGMEDRRAHAVDVSCFTETGFPASTNPNISATCALSFCQESRTRQISQLPKSHELMEEHLY